MAYGFRHIPKTRTADKRAPHYSCCGALHGLGNDNPHICKETIPGTIIAPLVSIPFRRDIPPELERTRG